MKKSEMFNYMNSMYHYVSDVIEDNDKISDYQAGMCCGFLNSLSLLGFISREEQEELSRKALLKTLEK